MEDFQVQPGSMAGHLILITGDSRYKDILVRAFPNCGFTLSFPDRFNKYDWGTYIHGPCDIAELKDLLVLFTQHLCIEDDLTESFALDRHGHWDPEEEDYVHTEIGKILSRAKPYGPGDGDRGQADLLVDRLAEFIRRHPTYRRADVIIPVPPSNPDKPFDLPTYMAERLAARVPLTNGTGLVEKIRVTQQQKQLHTPQEKVENVYEAFAVRGNARDKTVIVLDDLYQSGATINEVGRVIREAGAKLVLGLAVTKTQKDV